MIPKIIHYCWFGGAPKPKLAKKCIKSWRRYCRDWKIIEWNENNFDIMSCPLYVQQAYEKKKWAFVTDYVRLKLIYEHGGVYFDTDVELLKKIDDFLDYSAFFGLEDEEHINTGLGFGAEKETPILDELMSDYDDIPFVLDDGTLDILPCPQRNLSVFKANGLIKSEQVQELHGGVMVFPKHVFCPKDYVTGEMKKTKDTVSIHWFSASWHSKEEQKSHEKFVRSRKRALRKDYLLHLPNHILIKILGEEKYARLKAKLRKH